MKTLRFVIVLTACGVVGFSMGPVGCGGGIIPFGGDKSLERAVPLGSPEQDIVGIPQPDGGGIAAPVVAEARDAVSAVPCLMNYALAANPEYILVIKSNPAVVAIMGMLDFAMFSSFVGDTALVDELLAYTDELVIAGGESLGVIALVRIKADLIGADKANEDFQELFDKLIGAVYRAMERTAMQTGIPAPEDIMFSSFTNDPSAYIIGSARTLAGLTSQTAAIACNYCTVGACKASDAPVLYLSMQGAAFYEWVREILVESGSRVATSGDDALAAPFASSRFVLGIDIDEDKEINAAMALLDGKECVQDKLIASASVYIDVSRGFGKDLLNALIGGVLSSSTAPEIKEAKPEEPAPTKAELEDLLRDLYRQLADAKRAGDESRAADIQAQIDVVKQQLLDLYGSDQAEQSSDVVQEAQEGSATSPLSEGSLPTKEGELVSPAGVVSPQEMPELKDQSSVPTAPVREAIIPQIQMQRLKTPDVPEKEPDLSPPQFIPK